MSRPFDDGLQVERTLLAWRRTCLALALGVAVAIRYGEPPSLPFSLWIGLLALAALTLAYVSTSARYRRVNSALQRDPGSLPGGGAAVLAMAVVCGSLGVAAASHLLVSAFP